MPSVDRATPSTPELLVPDAAADAERYVRRTLWQLFAGLALLFVAMAAAGFFFEAELAALTTWVSDALGVPGMALVVFLIDGLTLPIPPDTMLVVVAHGPLQDAWLPIVGALGVASSLAGNAGYFAAGALGQTGFFQRTLGPHRARMESLFERYGALTVALGALTPIPFSVTCWAAGALRMRWSTFALVTLLRLPRFYAYYWVIAASAAVT